MYYWLIAFYMSSEKNASDEGRRELEPDEAFCTSCGEIIKEEAEVCPECGVRQKTSDSDLPQSRLYELQKIARKDISTVMIVSFLFTPVGYLMVGKLGLALINFFTLNYFLLGFIIVPFHTRKIIREARNELEQKGETW
jgi:predicted RNA-binding Zn-ribbon protein involved in translation (DUF1610 family)